MVPMDPNRTLGTSSGIPVLTWSKEPPQCFQDVLLGDGHPWSQTEGPEALNLTELKLCGTDLGNFWNIYFNEVSLAGHVLSHGSRGSWGSAHSQSHHELVCRNVLSGKDKTGSTTTSHRERPVLQQQGSWNASPGLLVLYFSHSAIIFQLVHNFKTFFFFFLIDS